ncbi:unnamed protein product [Periconia digitata]|uniref:Uncharacterized protein n=1 Tax=Periconia digitata TaxID=1303443 RepID=A0A9W4UB59_9PLEO|nr:unnamed protein product [Periconia digitata]
MDHCIRAHVIEQRCPHPGSSKLHHPTIYTMTLNLRRLPYGSVLRRYTCAAPGGPAIIPWRSYSDMKGTPPGPLRPTRNLRRCLTRNAQPSMRQRKRPGRIK